MSSASRLVSRRFCVGVVVLGSYLVASSTSTVLGQQVQPAVIDVTPRGIELIPPGTVIGQQAPEGWTNLVIKSQPRVGEADTRHVSTTTAGLAGFLFTGTLARVQAEQVGGQTRYRLTNIALGVGTSIQGRDTIISPDSQEKLGANLGFLARQVLSEWYTQQQTVRIVVSSPSMCIYDTPAVMQRPDGHRPVVLRYCLLLDTGSGRLQTLLWPIDMDSRGTYQRPFGAIEWLPPNKIEDCVLRVDPQQLTFGIPSATAFAISSIPQGIKKIRLSESDAGLVSLQKFTLASVQQLEGTLWALLAQAAFAGK